MRALPWQIRENVRAFAFHLFVLTSALAVGCANPGGSDPIDAGIVTDAEPEDASVPDAEVMDAEPEDAPKRSPSPPTRARSSNSSTTSGWSRRW